MEAVNRMRVDEAAEVFERHRSYLLGVAYRLTGSWADAEDAVADAWLRWSRHADGVQEPRGWLTRVVGRIALDQLRSARARHEVYVGPWLPEPIVTSVDAPATTADPRSGDPVDAVLWDESVRMAFLVVIDQLTPEQRLAVVLHDAAGLDFNEVAEVLGCSAAAARQHGSRGRHRLDVAKVPPRAPVGEVWAVLGELSVALQSGDTDRLAALLAPDVVLTGDGGGKVAAARRPLVGAEVARFLHGLVSRFAGLAQLQVALVNGEPGFVLRVDSDRPQDAKLAVYSFVVRAGRIEALYGVLAPDKVGRVPPPEDLTGPEDLAGLVTPSPAGPVSAAPTRLPRSSTPLPS